MKLHHRLIIHAIFGHLLLSLILYFLLSAAITYHLEKLLITRSERKAEGLFLTLYQEMLKGAQEQDLLRIIKNFQYEEFKVILYYGQNLPKDTLETNERIISKERGKITYRYLLRANEKCVKCHQVALNSILGIIEIENNYKMELKQISYIIFLILFFVALLIFPSLYIIGRRQASIITKPLGLLREQIRSSHDFEKLITTQQILQAYKTNIYEFDQFQQTMDEFISAVRKLAIDRGVYDFEIKLLEKFIITPEFINNWKYYIEKLLIDINQLVNIDYLFAIFCNNNHEFEGDIFWLYAPSEDTKLKVVNKAKEILKQQFGNCAISFRHYIVNKNQKLPDMYDIIIKSKHIVLPKPGIGGIVGVGISSQSLTYTQELAIEATLTSLLNMLGSTRAIDKYTQEIEFYSTRDPLTHLFNQKSFWHFLNYEIERAKRNHYKFALILIDLDNFQFINDSYGHAFGDRFLTEAANILNNIKRKGDILARYSGDEFTLILSMCEFPEAFKLAEEIRKKFENFQLMTPDGKPVGTTVTIGIGIFPEHAETAQDLFTLLDNLLKKAKQEGKNKIIYPRREDLLAVQREKADLVFMLKEAIEKGYITPYFQPIYDLNTNRVFAHEVLMRIVRDEEVIPASKFIELAEKLGLIIEMDLMNMEKALQIAQSANYSGYLFINLSPRFIIISEFLEKIQKLLKKYDFPKDKIVFEITERETVKNLKVLKDFILALQDHGLSFCVDDFGSGFSSFQYIKHFKINFVKIEGDFVLGLAKNEQIDIAIIDSIVALCKRLNIKMIAEYVENMEVLHRLKELGVQYGQGFYLGKPSALPIID